MRAPIPAQLHAEVQQLRERYLAAAAEADVHAPAHPDFVAVQDRVWACSRFVAENCQRDPALLRDLLDSGDLLTDRAPGELAACLDAVVNGVRDEESLMRALRRFRRREMVRIAWRDLAGWSALTETLEDLSALACACIDAALRRLHRWQCADWGVPRSRSGEAQSLVVIGMGKLGARELNFSSDIDLIFTFPEEGETDRLRRTNEEYFERLGQRLIQVIHAPTADGFVFRVDMRLRPYGDSGPLVMSFAAMEEYYQLHGRGWERYAMIKARPVAGDRTAAARLLDMLRPFVFRRYLDYGAFASLRDMKAMIAQEVTRKGMDDNIKLGAGGIREVEFIGQAFQLIRGGREPDLQTPAILEVLERLSAAGHLPAYVAGALRDAYVFLRRLENRLQELDDAQTHALPHDETDRLRLALAMGFEDWPTLARALARHRRAVHGHFEQVFAAPQAQTAAEADLAATDLEAAWRGAVSGEPAQAVLAEAGYDNPEEAERLLGQLRQGFAFRALGTQGRERLNQLMPLLLGAAGAVDHPTATLQRLVNVIEAIAGRTTYLSLLVENPMALSQLVKLCGASPWIAALLARYPLLLDELLDPRTLYAPLDRKGLEQELDTLLKHVARDDLEQQMEVLRQYKQTNVLRVAAADVAGVMPLMVVSDHLTEIAEVVLQRVLRLTWEHFVERHGAPQCEIAGHSRAAGFAIVGYGKLGGIELGYGSDLDLVFLHDSAGERQQTTGPKVIDNAVFFARLGQRIIHVLNTHMPGGVLYEVDMRLRPSGASGLLVSSLEAYADYQRGEAWTWEHQALVRARIVAGDGEIARRFQMLRAEVLGRERDPDALRKEVADMRARMRAELGSRATDRFDLKQDPGGIADIEFMVQYGVLRWARDHAGLQRYTDNIRLLDGLAADGLLPAADCRLLADAYRAYRARVHRLTLQDEPAVVDGNEFREFRAGVVGVWDRLMGG